MSITFSVNVYVPAALGMFLNANAPGGVNVRKDVPGGMLPDTSDQVNPLLLEPPLVKKSAVYCVPTVPEGSVVAVVIVTPGRS